MRCKQIALSLGLRLHRRPAPGARQSLRLEACRDFAGTPMLPHARHHTFVDALQRIELKGGWLRRGFGPWHLRAKEHDASEAGGEGREGAQQMTLLRIMSATHCSRAPLSGDALYSCNAGLFGWARQQVLQACLFAWGASCPIHVTCA